MAAKCWWAVTISLGAGQRLWGWRTPPPAPRPPLGLVMISSLQGKCQQRGLVVGHSYGTLPGGCLLPHSQQAHAGSVSHQAAEGTQPRTCPVDPGLCWPLSPIPEQWALHCVLSGSGGENSQLDGGVSHAQAGSWNWWVFAGAALVSAKKVGDRGAEPAAEQCWPGELGRRVWEKKVRGLALRGGTARQGHQMAPHQPGGDTGQGLECFACRFGSGASNRMA